MKASSLDTPPRVSWSANSRGLHPDASRAFVAANFNANATGMTPYGRDELSQALNHELVRLFGTFRSASMCSSGTAANALILSELVSSGGVILASRSSHVFGLENGAPERATHGGRVRPIATTDGKLRPADVEWALRRESTLDSEHSGKPEVLLVSQLTELGTRYTTDELKALADMAHKHQLKFVIDGARLFQASAAAERDLKALTSDCGADALSLDLSKMGGMGCVALFFTGERTTTDLRGAMKQMAFTVPPGYLYAAADLAILRGDLWRGLAADANAHAALLVELLKRADLKPFYPVDGNLVFVQIPPEVQTALEQNHSFYTWHKGLGLARFEVPFCVTESQIEALSRDIGRCGELLREFEQRIQLLSKLEPAELKKLHRADRITDRDYFAAWGRMLESTPFPKLTELVAQGVLAPSELEDVLIRSGLGHA